MSIMYCENSHLTNHMRTPTKEKPYECLFCENFLQHHQVDQAMKLEFTPKSLLVNVRFVKKELFKLGFLQPKELNDYKNKCH